MPQGAIPVHEGTTYFPIRGIDAECAYCHVIFPKGMFLRFWRMLFHSMACGDNWATE